MEYDHLPCIHVPMQDTLGIRNCTNAYMLVYVRNSSLPDSLPEVTDADISKALVARFAEEK